jgi:4-carboxymuconolactone decarboxylase
MRLLPLDWNKLPPEQQAVLEAIEAGPRGTSRTGIGKIGPFGAWVRAPSIGLEAQALGAAIRYNTSLDERVKEVAICTVGIFYRSKFEYSAHRSLAIKAGVSAAALDQLAANEEPDFTGPELISHTIASQMLNQHRILDETYRTGVEAFGEDGMVELVTTVGYYCLISLTLNSFEIPLEANMVDPFPDATTIDT